MSPLAESAKTNPWRLPAQGLALYESAQRAAELSHYFLPRLVQEGKNILILDGANSANPRLMARLGERRGIAFPQFCRQVRIARAFTCFQLSELIARVPQFLADFPAQALIVTALPELYFDEDVRDGDARKAFERALGDLRRWSSGPAAAGPPLAVAVFSSAAGFSPLAARKHFIEGVRAASSTAWKFEAGADGRMRLILTRAGAGGMHESPPRAALG